MLILHGSWVPASGRSNACFVLWAEMKHDAPVKRRASGSGGDSRLRPHPFAASGSLIQDGMTGAGVPPLHPALAALPLTVQLPSHDGMPLPTPLAGEEPFALEGAVQLATWKIEGFPLSAAEAAQRLLAWATLDANQSLVLGQDLRYWAIVTRFALSTMNRQRFLPGLLQQGATHLARWHLLLDDPDDALRYVALAQGMPPACRALAWKRESSVPSAADLLLDYLQNLVDTLARGAAALHRPTLPHNMRRLGRPPLGDRWLEALHQDGTIDGTGVELATFASKHRAWARIGEPPAGATDAFRILFRLDPPAEPPEDTTPTEHDGYVDARPPADTAPRWTLRYMLQATDDPTLQIPVAEVWQQRESSGRLLNRRFDRPQERVLAALGRAAQVFPALQDSLRHPRPEASVLTTAQAYQFISEKALLLQASGFAVQVPGLDKSLNVRLTLGRSSSTSAKNAAPPNFTWDSLIEYDWQLALGDQPLSRSEFEELATLKEPLVQLRGQWVELRPDQIARALAFLQRQRPGAKRSRGVTLPEALALALAPTVDVGLPLAEVETAGDFGSLLRTLMAGGRDQLAEPPGFVGTLRPYQRNGLSWLVALRRVGLGACLADDMGLGKTIQVIALLLHRRQEVAASEISPTLLVCPTSVAGNWGRELERFAPTLRVLLHHGARRVRSGFAEEVAGYDVVISTYSLLARDAKALGEVRWDALILDEAQNIKNASTRAAQVARGLTTGWRAALTGTPVENRLSELWSIFQFLNPGYLGSADRFRTDFAVPIERNGDTTAAERLKRLAGPFILRRLKTDRSVIQDLPEKNELKVFCTLTREQGTLYEAVLKDSLRALEESEGIERSGKILGVLTRLKQICDHPALFLHDGSALAHRSGKLSRLGEMLEEVLEIDDRALIFTQYAEMGSLLKAYLEERFGGEVLFLSGATAAAARDRMVARFQQEQGGPRLFILSIKAGGTGLNLTRANHVFHFDRWWNPAVENQATDRAFRIGQRRDVQVHKYICAGTFEEQLDAIIERKQALSESIVGAGEHWITEMSVDELRGLFALRHNAVQDE